MTARDAMWTSPLAHTYSIVARDPATGEIGVAVESHYFSVGPIVAWAEAGVGVVATQSLADPAYGKLGLDLMRAGRSAPEALAGLVASDPANAVRQVAMVDAESRVAAHTGTSAIAEAGHITGDGFSVQANMMLRATVWPAMAEAYQSTKASWSIACSRCSMLPRRKVAISAAANPRRSWSSPARTPAVHGLTPSTTSESTIRASHLWRFVASYRWRAHTSICGERRARWSAAISPCSIVSSRPLRLIGVRA